MSGTSENSPVCSDIPRGSDQTVSTLSNETSTHAVSVQPSTQPPPSPPNTVKSTPMEVDMDASKATSDKDDVALWGYFVPFVTSSMPRDYPISARVSFPIARDGLSHFGNLCSFSTNPQQRSELVVDFHVPAQIVASSKQIAAGDRRTLQHGQSIQFTVPGEVRFIFVLVSYSVVEAFRAAPVSNSPKLSGSKRAASEADPSSNIITAETPRASKISRRSVEDAGSGSSSATATSVPTTASNATGNTSSDAVPSLDEFLSGVVSYRAANNPLSAEDSSTLSIVAEAEAEHIRHVLHTHLMYPEAVQKAVAKLPSVSPFIVLGGPWGTSLVQERLIRTVAAECNAWLSIVPCTITDDLCRSFATKSSPENDAPEEGEIIARDTRGRRFRSRYLNPTSTLLVSSRKDSHFPATVRPSLRPGTLVSVHPGSLGPRVSEDCFCLARVLFTLPALCVCAVECLEGRPPGIESSDMCGLCPDGNGYFVHTTRISSLSIVKGTVPASPAPPASAETGSSETGPAVSSVDSLSPATEPAATTAIPVTNASNASGEDASPGVTYLRAILNRLFEKVSECPSDRHVLCLGEFTKLVSVDAQFATDLLARVEKAASLCSKHSGRFVMVLTVEASLPSKTSGLFLDGIPLMDMGDGRRRMRGGDDSHMRNPDSLFSDSMRGLSSTGAMTIFSVGAVPSGEDGESKDNDSSRESRRAGRLQSIKQIEKVFTTKIKLHAPSAEVTGPRGATSTSLRRWQEVVEKDARMLRFLVVSKLLTRTAASIGVTVTEAALNVLKADKYAKDQLLRTAAVEKILAWSLAFANGRPSTSQTESTDAAETLTGASSCYDTAVTTIDESHMVQALALYDRLKSTKGSSFITTTSSAASSSGDPSLQSAVHRLKNRDEIGTLCDNDFERRLITDIVLPHEIDTSFDDIGALDNVKTTMNELILLPLKRPELFRRGTLSKPTKGLLLFGPPGTGKTMLARALAHGADAAFMSISMASIGSKWFGDGERMVQAVFSLAKKLAPCIIFVDEVDAMLSQRSSSGKGDNNEHEAMRKIKNEFMMQWDGLKSSEADRIVVVGATNRPFDLDDAVLRRMPRRLLVDLPGPEQREAILRIMLKDDMKENALSPEVNLSAVAAETAGYSGSDLRAVCIAAAYRPIQELLRNEKADGRTREASELRQVTQEDFLAALREIAPSLHESTAAVASLREWNEMFGEGGSRNKKTLSYFM